MKIINVLCVGWGGPRWLGNEPQHDHLAAIAENHKCSVEWFS